MNFEDDHMNIVDDDIHDVVDLNMNEIKDEIDFEEIVKEW
jgi:hypothetical protein